MKQLFLLLVSMAFFITSLCSMTLRAQTAGTCFPSVPKRLEWMRTLPDSTPVCKLSIPGTHDSGACYGGLSLQTQGTDIPAQLRQGIRAFDIRLQEKDGKLGVYHSTAFQRLYWETDVLPAFLRFLQKYPSEMLVVSLKREGGRAEAYASLLSASLTDPVYRTYWVDSFRPGLTLGDCRGKILFLHRDKALERYPGAACTGWADDATCTLVLCDKDGQEGTALLQDEYQYASEHEADQKIAVCIRNLDAVAAEPDVSRRWGISFASATGLPSGTPQAFADQVNAALAVHLKEGGGARRGIVFIDFVGQADGARLVSLLINGNLQ